MDYSIEDIKKEYENVKIEIKELERQIEKLNEFKKQGKNTDEILKQKEAEKLEKLDVLLGIKEYCGEKIQEKRQKNTNALSVINSLKQSYDFLDKQYKLKPKRIKDQMKILENQMKEASKDIEIQKLPDLKEQEELEKLQKEIAEFIKNKNKENKKVENVLLRNVLPNFNKVYRETVEQFEEKEKNESPVYINAPKMENKSADLMDVFFSGQSVLPTEKEEDNTPKAFKINNKKEKNDSLINKLPDFKEVYNDTVEQFQEKEKNESPAYVNAPKIENKEVTKNDNKKEVTWEDVIGDFSKIARDTVEQFKEREKPVSDEELQKYLFSGENPIKAEIEKEEKQDNNTEDGINLDDIQKYLDTHESQPKKIKPLSPIIGKEINVSNPKESTEEKQADVDKMSEVFTRIKEKKNQEQSIEEPKIEEPNVEVTPEQQSTQKEAALTRKQYNDILKYLGKEDKIDGKVKRKVPKAEHEKKKKSTLKRIFNFFVQEIEVEDNEEIDYDRRKSL